MPVLIAPNYSPLIVVSKLAMAWSTTVASTGLRSRNFATDCSVA